MAKHKFIPHIKEGISDVFYIWKREFRITFHDTGVLIFFILVPLVYPVIYAFIYNNETLREVPIAVVDESRTSLSREYLRKIDATPDVKIESYCSDIEEAKLLMRKRVIYGIVVIPNNFSKDINTGIQTHVSIFSDMSGLMYYKCLLLANSSVSLDMNKDIKLKRVGNTTERQDEITAHPIAYQDVSLFNPANGFASFLLPAVLMLVIQQTLLLGIGLSAGTARMSNRFADLVPINNHYNGTLRIVLGKGLSYFMVYAVMAAYMICVIPKMFSLVQIERVPDLIMFEVPYILACIFFAMTLSIFIRTREACMLIFVFTSVPLLFISGISWPGAAIPQFWHYLSYLFPSTLGINGYVRLNSMGASINEVAFEYQMLWLQTGFYFITTCLVYRQQITRSRKHALARYAELKKKRDEKNALKESNLA